jgi:hypothetical protein
MLTLQLPDGARLDYERDPPLPFLKSTWHRDADGWFVYELDIDSRMLSRIGIGDGHAWGVRDAVASQPEGWIWLWNGWEADVSVIARPISPSGNTSRFSITSPMLPGPMPIQLLKKDAKTEPPTFGAGLPDIPMTLPRRLYDAALETLKRQTHFLNNVFAIGPVIRPTATDNDVRQLIHSWIDDYGFDFLAPLVSGGGPLVAKLAQLRPSTDFESQIAYCLREGRTL